MDEPCLPEYGGACVANIVPALLQHAEIGRGWLSDDVLDARQVVLLVLDGLGAEQLDDRVAIAPTMAAMTRSTVTTVAPTTTSTALTSITTGASPGEHGIVGYKVWVGGEVVNMLRWTTGHGDASEVIAPDDVQPLPPFLGTEPPTVSPREFMDSCFTRAHLRGGRYTPYAMSSSIPVDIRRALDDGARFVYAYYDGIDKIAHQAGLFEHYDAELAHVDALVSRVLAMLPPGAALVVTADHGQVQVGDAIVGIAPAALAHTQVVSGEARFVWLHAKAGRSADLCQIAAEAHSRHAWVRPVEQILDERWFGHVAGPARARLGDVALVAREPIALVPDPAQPFSLQSRHGSMTTAEVLVPLLTAAR